jgi:membrane-anchored protein YejM (alkaline phosphatase superfamily)
MNVNVRPRRKGDPTSLLLLGAIAFFLSFGGLRSVLVEGLVYSLGAIAIWAWGRARNSSRAKKRIWRWVAFFAFLAILAVAGFVSYLQFWR